MSRVKRFPIYTTRRGVSKEGCGHQHRHPEQAVNCGRSILHRHPMLRTIAIVKVRQRREGVVEKTIDMLEQSKCTECGNRIVTSEEMEYGHDLRCPLIGYEGV